MDSQFSYVVCLESQVRGSRTVTAVLVTQECRILDRAEYQNCTFRNGLLPGNNRLQLRLITYYIGNNYYT